MAFLVLLRVYFGSFLSRGFFSSLTLTVAYTWALLGPRTCQGQRRAGFSVTGERLKHFAECCLLGSSYSTTEAWAKDLAVNSFPSQPVSEGESALPILG